jgi:hypothetical protein
MRSFLSTKWAVIKGLFLQHAHFPPSEVTKLVMVAELTKMRTLLYMYVLQKGPLFMVAGPSIDEWIELVTSRPPWKEERHTFSSTTLPCNFNDLL